MLTPTHIVLLGLVLLLALVVFGPKRLPELGHSVGRAIQEFKHASTGVHREFTAAGTELHSTLGRESAEEPQVVIPPLASDGVTPTGPTTGTPV
ncbi:MAG TPA: twin-arginine translocase TatA/TatE family subunit [Candidatus Dormibacteraeota bacterium]